jgi:lipopolysaccharide biosynthesis protein
VGIWAAISKKLTIPIFWGTLTAVRYREIIQQFLKQLHDGEIENGYFQQDGAPAHTTYETLNMIQELLLVALAS